MKHHCKDAPVRRMLELLAAAKKVAGEGEQRKTFSLSMVRRQIKAVGGTLEEDASGRGGSFHLIAPCGSVWTCRFVHDLAYGYSHRDIDLPAIVPEMLNDIAQGLTPCEDPYCDFWENHGCQTHRASLQSCLAGGAVASVPGGAASFGDSIAQAGASVSERGKA